MCKFCATPWTPGEGNMVSETERQAAQRRITIKRKARRILAESLAPGAEGDGCTLTAEECKALCQGLEWGL